MQQHGSIFLPAGPQGQIPPLDPGVQNSTFSEHGHVAYNITGNHERSNMVASIMPADPTPESVGQSSTFSEHGHVAYQITGNHECSNIEQIFCPQTPPPDPEVKGSKFKFSEHGHVAYIIKGNDKCSNIVANILPAEMGFMFCDL